MPDDMHNQRAISLKISTPGFPFRKTPPTWWFKACGLAVHCYTASGAILAFLIVLAAIHGNIVQALWLALVALIIDGTDGWLARRFRVSETLPWFDGRRLDDIVDYLTYAFAPILLLWNTGHLPNNLGGMFLAALPLLASGYQFCRTDAKTADHFFLGFPSYWNVVAFYAIIFHQSPLLTGIILLICSLLVFIPIRYLYPSRTIFLRPLTLVLTALWLLCYALIVQQMPAPSPWLMYLSLLYIIYYVGMSLYLTFRMSVFHTKH
jgi:phosphatidylcholine synthase